MFCHLKTELQTSEDRILNLKPKPPTRPPHPHPRQALGVFKLAATGVAVATVDSWGRRPLLLWGVSALIAALLALGALAAGVVPLPEGAAGWANLGALLLYVGAYQLSFGPVSWLVVGEVRVVGGWVCWGFHLFLFVLFLFLWRTLRVRAPRRAFFVT